MYFQMKFILEDCEPSRLIIKVYILLWFVRKLQAYLKKTQYIHVQYQFNKEIN